MKKITLILLLTVVFTNAFSQRNVNSLENARKYLKEKGEVILKFKATSKEQFLELNQILSVDHHYVDENLLEVQAYANQKQFETFLTYGLPFEVTKEDNEIPQEFTSRNYSIEKNGTISTLAGSWDTTWDSYPKYSEYVAKLQYWVATYPTICSLQNIGATPNGRALYVLKISDNVATDETEPEFLYTSSMHGDEITGYPTMMHFIDYLLTNYGSNTEVNTIINGTELFICPLANPDGSYKSVGNDVYNSSGNTPTRANSNGYDLNRNYPDPEDGLHADKALQTNANYQPETIAFLNFQATRNFVLSVNYHGGAEVVNYPWDTYATGAGANIHPHDNYFKLISQEYAQLCQTADGNSGYMDDVLSSGAFPGTTNGSAWYTIAGGRQDGNNYLEHNKEVTIEISSTKTPAASSLPGFWTKNKQAILNFVKQANFGLQGIVSDTDGNPVAAKIYVSGTTDGFGAWTKSSSIGDYHKVQIAGTYNVIFEAPGYTSQTLTTTISNFNTTILNVTMIPVTSTPTASNVSIYQGQTATVTATGTGTFKWFDSLNSTAALSSSASYTTPTLNTTTSYFVEQLITPTNIGPATVSGNLNNNTNVKNKYVIFNCTTPTKLKSVLINASGVGQLFIELKNSSDVILESKVVRLTSTGDQDINLNFYLPAQNNLRLVIKEIGFTSIKVLTSGLNYPSYTNGTVSLTGDSGSNNFLPFFNWKFEPIKSLRKEVVVTVKPYTWNGSVSNVWTNANNWSPNIVPDGSKDVLIPLGNPSLNTDFTLAVGTTLTVNGTGTLTIEPNRVLKIDGTADFNNKSVIFKSDANGTGIFGELTGTATGLTKVTVQRYIQGRRAFRFLTPGVTTTTSIYQNWQNNGVATSGIGTHITGGSTGGFDLTGTNNPSMHTYNAQATGNTTGFTPISNTNATILSAGVGYRILVRGDRNVVLTNPSADNMNVPTTLSATGTLKTGPVTFDTNLSSPVPMNNTTNTQTNGYSLIGNPYVSPVDWHAITKTNVKNNAYYTWDPTLGTTAQRGRYVVYSETTGTSNIYVSGTDTNLNINRRYLQSGQAVFVKNRIAGTVANLTFNESNKANVNSYVFKSSNQSLSSTNNSSLFITMYDSIELAIGGSPIDGALAMFGNDFTNSIDDNDVDKLQSSGENVAFLRDNKDLAIETLSPVVADDELFVKTSQLQANKNYTFKINTENFDTTVNAKLVDMYLNNESILDLTQPSFVAFNTTSDSASFNVERFKIIFNNALLSNNSFGMNSISLYPNPIVDNQFTLALPTSLTGQVAVSITNMLGQEVYKISTNASPSMVIKPTQHLQEGIYIVSIANNNQITQIKVIVKKQ